MRDIIEHYDRLIDEGHDPVCDPEVLRRHMDGWDGQAFLDALKSYTLGNVLEIGVGTGRLAVRVAPLCQHFTGIDLSPKTLARAAEAVPATLDEIEARLGVGGRLWFVAPLDYYPEDEKYYGQIRRLKAELDARYALEMTMDDFRGAPEWADISVYRRVK